MTDTWYSPQEIRFRREHIEFLLESLPLLQEGIWPPGTSSGYTEAEHTTTTRRHKAAFETPSAFAGDIESRLEKAGRDGEIVLIHYAYRIPLHRLAVLTDIEEPQLARIIQRVISYISGWRFWSKKRTYNETVSHRRVR